MIVKAPWTKAQCEALNRWQNTSHVHPFMCNDVHSDDRILIAVTEGWVCLHCGYQQDWALDFMFKEPPTLEVPIAPAA